MGSIGPGIITVVVAIIGLTVVATVSLGIVLLTSRVLGWGAGT